MRVKLEERLEAPLRRPPSPLNRVELNESGDRRLGIVTSGAAYQYVKETFPDANILKIGWAYPFPDKLFKSFAEQVECVVVIEELEDFMEQHLSRDRH